MHFSTLAASMLVAQASAWRWNGWYQPQPQEEVVTQVVTVNGPVVTQYEWAEAAQPVTTEVAAPVVTEAAEAVVTEVVAAPTTLVQKKKTSTAAPAATSASTGSSGSLTADQQGALDAHNAARKEVGNEPLTWDATLEAAAKEWADTMAASAGFEHSGVQGMGENLYMQYDTKDAFTNAVNMFVGEKSEYNGEAISESNYMSFGHYTQVVWKSTTKVGMALATGSDGAVYVVARYTEPGNMIGDTPY